MGPTLEFTQDTVIAITGANMKATLDGEFIELWKSIYVKSGQILAMKFAQSGVRSYIAFAGGIDSPAWLGSQSTFHKAGVGGIEGHALKAGQTINTHQVSELKALAKRTIVESARPDLSDSKHWNINVVLGPNDDWLDDAGIHSFLNSSWKLSSKSDRTGFRLDGPDMTFSHKAHHKAPEHGSEPSNIIDQGYPVGAINLAGQVPIILMSDGPSMGGFINPFTVPTSEFWKLAQASPAAQLNFNAISVDEAQQNGANISEVCSVNSFV